MSWITKLPALLEFCIFYIKEVILSNIRVAIEVLVPAHGMRPDIVSVNTEGMTDRQLLVLANLITMTPGTLSVDITEDRRSLQIHAMYVDDAQVAAQELERDFVRRVKRVF
ncbi:MAG: Na+/H+ antiporter subunit E [Verrucomicrobiota bacterium]